MRHQKILIISTNFYPKITSGTQRIHSFCRKYLGLGCQVDVLTGGAYAQKNAASPFESERHLRIFRAEAVDIKDRFSIKGWIPSVMTIPDRFWPWYFKAAKLFNRLSRNQYDFMLSSSPIPTAHLIALRLKKRNHWKWICDFRDPWYLTKINDNCPWYQCQIEKFFENKVISQADIITVTNDSYKNYLKKQYKKDIYTVSNGFSAEDFQALPGKTKQNNRKIFSHIGNLYGTYRDPTFLLEAMSGLKNQKIISSTNFCLELIGDTNRTESPSFRKQLEDLDVTDLVKIEGRVPYRQSLERMMQSDCLVLLQCDPNLRYQIPAKIYEYIKCKKPILGLVPEGATRDLLSSLNPDWCIHPDDGNRIADFIKSIINEETSLLNCPNDDKINSFDREYQVERLARLTGSI